MKITSKGIWKIAAVLIAAGLLLGTVGWLLGARGGIYIDRNGVHVEKNSMTNIAERDLDAFTDISLDMRYANIELVRSDHYGIEAAVYDYQDLTWSDRDGKLRVEARGERVSNIITLGDWGPTERYYVKIYFPADTALERVKLSTGSGNITVSDAGIRELTVVNAYGNLNVKNLTAGSVNVDMSSGNFTITDSEADFIGVRNRYGKIRAANLTSRGIRIDADSGDVTLSGALSGENAIDNKYGRVVFNTSAGEQTYSYDLAANYGDITLNGQRRGSPRNSVSKSTDAAPNTLNIHASSGNIEVSFGK